MSAAASETNSHSRQEERVAAALREMIQSGRLEPGAKLPTRGELARQFNVNEGAVRLAQVLLRKENLLTPQRQGTPPRVVDTLPPAAGVRRPGHVELLDRIEVAFRAEHVSIDTFSYSTETLTKAVQGLEARLIEPSDYPRTITVRAIVPSPDFPLSIPRLVGDPTDGRPSRRMHALAHEYARVLQRELEGLSVRRLVEHASIEVRGVPITPISKWYLLNDEEALEGTYQLKARPIVYGRGETAEELETLDITGVETPLLRSSAHEAGEADRYRGLRRLFDELWNRVGQDVALGF